MNFKKMVLPVAIFLTTVSGVYMSSIKAYEVEDHRELTEAQHMQIELNPFNVGTYDLRIGKLELQEVMRNAYNNDLAIFMQTADTQGKLIHMGSYLGEPKGSYYVKDDMLGGLELPLDSEAYASKDLYRNQLELISQTVDSSVFTLNYRNKPSISGNGLISSKSLSKLDKVDLNFKYIKEDTRYILTYIYNEDLDEVLGVYAEELPLPLAHSALAQQMGAEHALKSWEVKGVEEAGYEE